MTLTLTPDGPPAADGADGTTAAPTPGRLPLLGLLVPAGQLRLTAASVGAAVVAALWWRVGLDRPLWQAVAVFLMAMTPWLVVKGWHDTRRHGLTVAVAVALVTVQGLHGVEHVAQWVQRHLLGRPMRASNGLLSPANSEWVHFVWNWLVLVVVLWLVARGMRSGWAWLFLAWTTAHTLEHTYLMIRFLQVGADLDAFGFPGITTQGLPGVVGQDGWLDRNQGIGGPVGLFCQVPFLTTATRLDAHAAWNAGETLLMLPAVNTLLRRTVGSGDRSGRVAHDQLDGQQIGAGGGAGGGIGVVP